MLPIFPIIAGGNVDGTGLAPGDRIQGAQGCSAEHGLTGQILVQLNDPYDGLSAADVIVTHNPGFGSSKAGGGLTTTMGSYAAGQFIFTLWDQTTVPPVAIDGTIHFTVTRMYPSR